MKLLYSMVAIVLLAVQTLSLSAATVRPTDADVFALATDWVPSWRSVGHDSCGDNPRCTPAWAMQAMEKAGVLPADVATAAIAAFVKADSAVQTGLVPDWQSYQVCEGDVVATTFGATGEPTLAPRIRATFTDCTAGLGWTFTNEETGDQYQIFRVTLCGNYTVRLVTRESLATFPQEVDRLLAALVPEPSPHGVTSNPGSGCMFCGGGGDGHSNPPPPPPPPPAPVPLPESGLLLFVALLLVSVRTYSQKKQSI